MGPLALAEKYMDVFFSGRDLDRLKELFTEDLRFRGPFHESDSAAEYIDSLKSDPPMNCHYQIIRAFEDSTSACLIYEFSKPGVLATMAQLFETKNGKISSISLVFDSGNFAAADEVR